MKKRNVEVFGNGMEILLGVAIIFAFILPHTTTLLRLVNPILCVLLFFIKKNKSVVSFCWAPIIAIFISIILNISGEASSKSVFAAMAILIYLFSFPMVRNVKINNIYLYLAFGIVFLSQIGYLFNIAPVITLVDRYYPIAWNEKGIAHMINTIDTTNYSSFRLGGLYRNPNQCSKYVTLLLSVYLINNKNKTIIHQAWFISLCFFSVLLTGSRTGLAVASIMIMLALYDNKKMSKWILVVVVAIFIGVILKGVFSGSSFRGFEIEDGFSNSMGLKFKITMKYISEEQSVVKMLFGHLDSDLFETNTSYSLDCEYGYVIYCYGFVGFVAFLLFYIKMFRKLEKEKRMFFVVLLWMISSSIMMAYRTAFVFMLLLSTIYNDNKGIANLKLSEG